MRMRLSYEHAQGILRLDRIAGYSSVNWQSRKGLTPSEVEGPQDKRASWKLGTTINDNEITEHVLKLLNCADALLNDVRPGFYTTNDSVCAIRTFLPVPSYMVKGSSIFPNRSVYSLAVLFLVRRFHTDPSLAQQADELVDEGSLESLGSLLTPRERTDITSEPIRPRKCKRESERPSRNVVLAVSRILRYDWCVS
jgi:hypothetical protein